MSNGTKLHTNGLTNGVKNFPNMLDAVDNLKNAGVEQSQAEAIVKMQYALIDSHLANKHDIALVQRDIAEIGLKLTIRVLLMHGGLAAFIMGLAVRAGFFSGK